MVHYMALKLTAVIGVLVAAIVIVLMVGTRSWCSPSPTSRPGGSGAAGGDQGFDLWIDITNRQQSLQARRQAAKALSASAAGDPWVMILLMDKTAIYRPEESKQLLEAPKLVRESLDSFNAAIIAALLESIPSDASPAILWAVTHRLSDDQRGRYSELRGEGRDTVRLELETPPLKELAKKVLVRCLRTDLGYNAVKWREAIIQSRTGTGKGDEPQ